MTESTISIDWQQLMAKLLASPSSLTSEEITILQKTPAVAPPPGIVPNLEDPQTIKNIHYGITSPLLALMLMAFLNRAYVKTVLVKTYGWDDFTLLLSFLGVLAYFSVTIWECESGKVGTHLWDINVLDSISEDFMVPSYILVILPNIIFGTLKTTFFLLFLQLFKQQHWIRICIYIGLVLNTTTYTALSVAMFYFATPRPGEKFYTHDLTEAGELAVPASVAGFIMDVIILIIPIVAISGLQTSTRKKIGAMVIFLSGLLACICSALSIYYRLQLDSNTRGSDITYKLIGVNASLVAEMMIGVTCACMPSLAYSYRHIPAVQVLKNKVSSYFSTSDRTKHSSAEGTIGSMGRKFQAIRKTNEVYITMKDYYTHTNRLESQSLDSQALQSRIMALKPRDSSYVYDERDVSEIFEGSGHSRQKCTRSGHPEEKAKYPYTVF